LERIQLFSDSKIIRKAFLTGFFHFAQSYTTLLLLLLVGQITSQSDSTKADVLQHFSFGLFNSQHQWNWVIVLLILKAFFIVVKNYQLRIYLLELQLKIQDFFLFKATNEFNPNEGLSKDIKLFAKSWIKGNVSFIADVVFLTIIFVNLYILNIKVAFSWLLVFFSAISFRYAIVHVYVNQKNSWKRAHLKVQRKLKFILSEIQYIFLFNQYERELEILNKRRNKNKIALQKFSFQKAWETAFLPTLFFTFIFTLISPAFSDNIERKTLLQLVLILIYSQSSMYRTYKVTESWKHLRNIKLKWLNTTKNKTKNEHSEDLILKSIQWESLSNGPSLNIVTDITISKFLKKVVHENNTMTLDNIKLFNQNATILSPSAEIRGETLISAISGEKESKALQNIETWGKQFDIQFLKTIEWQINPTAFKTNSKEWAWFNVMRSSLHQASMVISTQEDFKFWSQNEQELILKIFNTVQKKWLIV